MNLIFFSKFGNNRCVDKAFLQGLNMHVVSSNIQSVFVHTGLSIKSMHFAKI